ncbi:MAG: metal-dependent transcriptional regulator [Dehalococcoidia bacterium]
MVNDSVREDINLSQPMENYLLTIFHLNEDNIEVTVTNLAQGLREIPLDEHIGTSMPSVTGMISRMKKENLIKDDEGRSIVLTELGEYFALDMVRRHRVAERMVVDLLGVPLDRAHIEAHKLEHAISPELLEVIIQKLGNPRTSPFGETIPGEEGQSVSDDGVIGLDEASIGTNYVIRSIPEEDPELIKFFIERGVLPGTPVSIVESGKSIGVVTVGTPDGSATVGFEVAARIKINVINSG